MTLDPGAFVSIPREDSCFWEPTGAITNQVMVGFNPQRGFMLLGTNIVEVGLIPDLVSIPREDSCFWELGFLMAMARSKRSFNPQRGFMLLGTTPPRICHPTIASFQSPERIHAFGNQMLPHPHTLTRGFNPQRGFMLLGTCQWRRCPRSITSFNPQRGFMLLGTCATRFARCGWDAFQSPERIHAFGNNECLRPYCC